MLKIMRASFLNRMRRPNHSHLWNTSFPFALSASSTFMRSTGGCRALHFLPGILYPGSATVAELIGHLQHQNTKKYVRAEGRISESKGAYRKLNGLIPREVR